MTSEIFLAFFKFGSSNANTIFRNWKMNSHFTTKMKISSHSTISKNLSMCELSNHYQPVTEIKLYKLIQWLILYLNKIQHNVKNWKPPWRAVNFCHSRFGRFEVPPNVIGFNDYETIFLTILLFKHFKLQNFQTHWMCPIPASRQYFFSP